MPRKTGAAEAHPLWARTHLHERDLVLVERADELPHVARANCITDRLKLGQPVLLQQLLAGQYAEQHADLRCRGST